MTIALSIALIAAVAVVALVVVVATRPAAFRIARTTTVAAPAETVFALLADFRAWSQWSPYEKLDPAATKTFEGPPAGVGAGYHYVGKKVGEGRMTITAATPGQRVAIRAEFIRPFTATNQIELTLAPAPGGVTVTWAMTGNNSFVFKAFSLLVDIDRMLGKDVEQGLADLKRVAEAARPPAVTMPVTSPVTSPAAAVGH
jgi:uncharacterized protein YndB with AHSA1/START domain